MCIRDRQKDIYRVFQYHGAEHKTIFCYEAGLPLTVENVRIQPRHHPRCGTSFLFVVIFVSILVSSVAVSYTHLVEFNCTELERKHMAKQPQSCAFRTSIGGQALIEGILMRGPEKQAIVVRDQEGNLVRCV